MKAVLIILLVLQTFCATLWLQQRAWMKASSHQAAEAKYQQGLKDGQREIYRKITNRQIKLPKELQPPLEKMSPSGGYWKSDSQGEIMLDDHVFWPALCLQIFTLGLTLIAISRFKSLSTPSEGS